MTMTRSRVLADYAGNGNLNSLAGNSTDGVAFGVQATLKAVLEDAVISATAASGTITFDVLTQAVLYYTSNATANWTLNIRGDGSNTLNSLMTTDDVVTIAFLATQGVTPYYQNALQVDGVSVTPKWLGGSAPTSGSASGIDLYHVTVIKTGDAAFTALAQVSDYS